MCQDVDGEIKTWSTLVLISPSTSWHIASAPCIFIVRIKKRFLKEISPELDPGIAEISACNTLNHMSEHFDRPTGSPTASTNFFKCLMLIEPVL